MGKKPSCKFVAFGGVWASVQILSPVSKGQKENKRGRFAIRIGGCSMTCFMNHEIKSSGYLGSSIQTGHLSLVCS